MAPKYCPSCNASFETDDVYEYFLKEYGDEEKAMESAKMFGWEKERPCSFSRCIGLYDYTKDKTTHWECPDCKHRWERTR
jgi:hypothetical protein